MNRIYKVIWDSTRQCYVVASELAKGAGKAARNKKGIATGLTLAVLLSIGGGTGVVSAADDLHYVSVKGLSTATDSNVNNDGAKEDYAIAIGDTATAKYEKDLAIGRNATAYGYNEEPWWDGKQDLKGGAVAIGDTASAKQAQAIAIGSNSSTVRPNSVAIGAGATIKDYVPYWDGNTDYQPDDSSYSELYGGGVAIGYQAKVGNKADLEERIISDSDRPWINPSYFMNSYSGIALGDHAQAFSAQAMAVGNWSSATGTGSMALGLGSIASGYAALSLGTGTAKGEGSVTLGASTVAEEALGAIALGPNRVYNYSGMKSRAPNSGWGMNTVGVSGATAKGAYTIAIGAFAEADTMESIALGNFAKANRATGVPGYDPATNAASKDTSATWKSTTGILSIGGEGIVDFIDFKTTPFTRQITGVAAGSEDTDAVNVAQLKKAVEAMKPNSGGTGVAVDTRNTVKAGENVDVKEAANTDGSSTYTVSVKANGQVDKDNTGVVTGGTVYKETRVAQDGAYVKAANSAGENLMVLDHQVKQNTDTINTMGNRINRMDARIDRVGAGAAALAALHPQDFDPNDKWDFAAGYGHYRNANAMAIGAFYRPDGRTMFSVGGSMGGGENLVNVGLTLKLGKSSPYAGYSKAALTTVIADQKAQLTAQQQQLNAQQEENKALKTQVQNQQAQITSQQAQINAILQQLEAMKK